MSSGTLQPLLLYRNFYESEIVSLVSDLCQAEPGPASATLYARAFALLASEGTTFDDPWRDFVRRAVLSEETAFSVAARNGNGAPPDGLVQAMRHDLSVMEALHAVEGDELAEKAQLPSWRPLGRDDPQPKGMDAVLARTKGWDELIDELWEHFRSHSAGPLGSFLSFRWTSGGLQPVMKPDPMRLSDLIGYGAEQALLKENTEIFADGHWANNVLLYGPRGTGKSSTVRALVNEYREEGLRLVQVERPHLADFPAIIAELCDRPERFVIFLDDLAFELGENEYAHLKGLLEGGLQTRPDNVVVYATSNRRHLVDERFADRDGADDVVHVTDTYQHKLSLADRFGVTILFPAADQARYLSIVEELVRRRGLDVSQEQLHRDALRWSSSHNGFSPRGGQQFVDHLSGLAALRSRRGKT